MLHDAVAEPEVFKIVEHFHHLEASPDAPNMFLLGCCAYTPATAVLKRWLCSVQATNSNVACLHWDATQNEVARRLRFRHLDVGVLEDDGTQESIYRFANAGETYAKTVLKPPQWLVQLLTCKKKHPPLTRLLRCVRSNVLMSIFLDASKCRVGLRSDLCQMISNTKTCEKVLFHATIIETLVHAIAELHATARLHWNEVCGSAGDTVEYTVHTLASLIGTSIEAFVFAITLLTVLEKLYILKHDVAAYSSQMFYSSVRNLLRLKYERAYLVQLGDSRHPASGLGDGCEVQGYRRFCVARFAGYHSPLDQCAIRYAHHALISTTDVLVEVLKATRSATRTRHVADALVALQALVRHDSNLRDATAAVLKPITLDVLLFCVFSATVQCLVHESAGICGRAALDHSSIQQLQLVRDSACDLIALITVPRPDDRRCTLQHHSERRRHAPATADNSLAERAAVRSALIHAAKLCASHASRTDKSTPHDEVAPPVEFCKSQRSNWSGCLSVSPCISHGALQCLESQISNHLYVRVNPWCIIAIPCLCLRAGINVVGGHHEAILQVFVSIISKRHLSHVAKAERSHRAVNFLSDFNLAAVRAISDAVCKCRRAPAAIEYLIHVPAVKDLIHYFLGRVASRLNPPFSSQFAVASAELLKHLDAPRVAKDKSMYQRDTAIMIQDLARETERALQVCCPDAYACTGLGLSYGSPTTVGGVKRRVPSSNSSPRRPKIQRHAENKL